MEPKTRRLLIWIGGVILGVLLAVAVAVGVGIYLLGRTVVGVADTLRTETDAAVRPAAVNGQLEFDLTYGKDVMKLAAIIVYDADGKELWKLQHHADKKPATIVYGVVPAATDKSWTQVVPADGTPPPDVRGKRIKYEVSCRFLSAFGVGHQSTRGEFDVP